MRAAQKQWQPWRQSLLLPMLRLRLLLKLRGTQLQQPGRQKQ
jgi:hypothetical protein